MRDESDRDNSQFEAIDDPDHVVRTNMSLQWDLHDAMLNAQEQGQFVGGVHNAAEQLDQDASSISLCILVDTKRADPGIQINCRLIEAFCWEFPIPLIKVSSHRKLKVLAGYDRTTTDAVHCILIKGTTNINPSLEKIIQHAQQRPGSIIKLT